MKSNTLAPSLPQLPAQARTLGYLLREVYGRLQNLVYTAVAAAGHPDIRPAHSPVLRHLPPEGGRVADLARTTGLAKQSVTYVVEDLVALGYLQTRPDPEDRRARRLTYTARGQQLLADLLAASQDAEDALGETLGAQQTTQLRAALEAVLTAPQAARLRQATPAARSQRRAVLGRRTDAP